MKTFNFKLIIGIIGLVLIFSQCQKTDVSTTEYQVVEYCDDCRSGQAPFFNLQLLSIDSTQVTERPTQIQVNGNKIAKIHAIPSGGQGASYLGKQYNHYSSCSVTYTDGSEMKFGAIYISYMVSGNMLLTGTLPQWSKLKSDHPSNYVRYVRTLSYRPAYLPLRGESWRCYSYLVNGQRLDMMPTSQEHKHFRIF